MVRYVTTGTPVSYSIRRGTVTLYAPGSTIHLSTYTTLEAARAAALHAGLIAPR